MLLNDAESIYVGNNVAKKAYLGDKNIWIKRDFSSVGEMAKFFNCEDSYYNSDRCTITIPKEHIKDYPIFGFSFGCFWGELCQYSLEIESTSSFLFKKEILKRDFEFTTDVAVSGLSKRETSLKAFKMRAPEKIARKDRRYYVYWGNKILSKLYFTDDIKITFKFRPMNEGGPFCNAEDGSINGTNPISFKLLNENDIKMLEKG